MQHLFKKGRFKPAQLFAEVRKSQLFPFSCWLSHHRASEFQSLMRCGSLSLRCTPSWRKFDQEISSQHYSNSFSFLFWFFHNARIWSDSIIRWARARRAELEKNPSTSIEFKLHRVRYMQILTTGSRADAIAYAQTQFPPFAAANLRRKCKKWWSFRESWIAKKNKRKKKQT